jgi:transposase
VQIEDIEASKLENHRGFHEPIRGYAMKLAAVGIDIANFQIHHVDEETGEIVSKPIKRAKFLAYFANPAQLVKFRTMQSNGLRGLLAEYGEVTRQGRASLDKAPPEILGRRSERLPAVLLDSLREQWARIGQLDERIGVIERRMRKWKKEDAAVQAISEIPGVGLLAATAAVTTMGEAHGRAHQKAYVSARPA